MKKRVAILGSTGSIGANTLKVIDSLRDRFEVAALSADSNIKLLSEQAAIYRPKVISVRDEDLAAKIKNCRGVKARVLCGTDGLREIVSRSDVDLVVFAISGNSCIMPLMDAIDKKKRIALANKESIVSAGPILMKLAAKRAVRIVPIDSEHSAIFQCIGDRRGEVERIYLTGSGGPLLDVKSAKFNSLGCDFVLNHPRWSMGKKISVDSATMMNKGLEIIEAKYLFNISEKHIEVVVHPEAIIHSMVEFTDGAVLAQLALPDMRIPIQYALSYPDRLKNDLAKVNFFNVAKLTFRKPDDKKFPCLSLARKAASEGGTAPAVLCAADEIAVARYLDGKIRFTDIPKVIEKVLSLRDSRCANLTIDDILAADRWAREEAESICSR